MTSKRMKKLLMAKGISRNGAEYIRRNLRLYDANNVMWTNADKANRIDGFKVRKSSDE